MYQLYSFKKSTDKIQQKNKFFIFCLKKNIHVYDIFIDCF